MAARRTRAAARRAALVPFLSELSDDEIEKVGYALADPLAPRLAVALSSCSRGLRRALAAPLKELKERRQKAEELCAYVMSRSPKPLSCDKLRGATELLWGDLDLKHGVWYSMERCTPRGRMEHYMEYITAVHVETLGMLLATSGLPQLQRLHLDFNRFGAKGMTALAGGLAAVRSPA